jgi:competence protein ComEC
MMKSVVTRFRAYQLGCPGSSFSLFARGHFTVMEGRLTDLSRASLEHEMKLCGVDCADNLDITSWDSDHCNRHELEELLELIQPLTIQCHGYNPYTDHGEGCIETVRAIRTGSRVSSTLHPPSSVAWPKRSGSDSETSSTVRFTWGAMPTIIRP